MRYAAPLLAFALAGVLAGCGQAEIAEPVEDNGLEIIQPDVGSNDIFREATAAAPGHELIVADLLLEGDTVGAEHYHPWEEYLYILGGSAVLQIEGEEPRDLTPGDAIIIPRETNHTPIAGPDGVRAIVVRVHDEGDPVRVLVEDE